jgi:hypothetical protein
VHDQPKHSPCWQGLRTTGRVNDAGRPIPGDPIIINCHGHTDVGICADCADQLRRVLADIPRLLDDLDIAIAGESRFVEHGARAGGSNAETASSRHPAIAAQQRLTLALYGDQPRNGLGLATRPAKPAEPRTRASQSHPGDNRPSIGAHPGVSDWFDTRDPARLATQLANKLDQLAHEPRMPNLARDISAAASRAHHVIDAPPELWYYGPCPSCERDLWQERIHHEDTKTPIVCRFPSCDYAAPLDVHNRRALEVGHDRQMTLDELVGAITSGGIAVTRGMIEGWIYRDGLPRLKRNRPRYVDGELKQNEVWTYRLGDVLDYALRAAAKRNRSLSTHRPDSC